MKEIISAAAEQLCIHSVRLDFSPQTWLHWERWDGVLAK